MRLKRAVGYEPQLANATSIANGKGGLLLAEPSEEDEAAWRRRRTVANATMKGVYEHGNS
jgi:hypothetical protein